MIGRRVIGSVQRSPGTVAVALAALVVVTLGARPRPAASQLAPPERGRVVAAIDSVARAHAAREDVPGLIVAVAKGADVLVDAGYGMADLEHGVLASAESVFKIGSVTKQFAAVAILQLVERGRLSLDDDVRTFFPDLRTDGRRITVRMLLNHTSGLKNYTSIEDFHLYRRTDLTDRELVDVFGRYPLDFEPGTAWGYSNSGYYLAGMIVQRLSGKSFAEYVEDELLEPLGLENTYYCDDYALIPGRAAGYDATEAGLRNTRYVSMHVPGAAGAMCATAGDLVRWTRALHAGRVVGPASLAQMSTPVGAAKDISPLGERARTAGNLGYGLGMIVHDFKGHRELHHGGGINGFRTEVAYYPDHDLIVAVSVNASGMPPMQLMRDIAAAVVGFDPRPSTQD